MPKEFNGGGKYVPMVGGRQFFQKIFLPRARQVDVITVHGREDADGWSSQVRHGALFPIDADDLRRFVTGAGFDSMEAYGDYAGAPFEGENSWDLILTAIRA